MRILGDSSKTNFNCIKEPGTIFGFNDVLKGPPEEIIQVGEYGTFHRLFGWPLTFKQIDPTPKLYVHFSNTWLSSFTGLVRKYCLPWRWKTAHISWGNNDQSILNTSEVLIYVPSNSRVSGKVESAVGKSFHDALLMDQDYEDVYGHEFVLIPQLGKDYTLHRDLFLGGFWSYSIPNAKPCQIFRIRSLWSAIKYFYLKHTSDKWEEVSLRIGRHFNHPVAIYTEALILREDRADLTAAGFIFNI